MSTNEEEILASEILSENEEKGKQIRFVISSFRGVHYMHLREYYLGFEGEYLPSIIGVNIPVSIESTKALFRALATAISDSELKFILDDIYNELNKNSKRGE